MPSLAETAGLLNSWFEFSAFPEDTGNGLAVIPFPDRPVARIGYAVNCSWEVIEDAQRQSVDLLLTHHAAWDEIEGEIAEEKRQRLKASGIAHYVCHLPLDCADFGTAATLCELLGITVEGSFADIGEGGQAGRYGSLPQPIALNAFTARLSDVLDGVAPYVLLSMPTVHRVGIVTGGGSMTTLLEEARSVGCDTYLTGEGTLYTKLYARETGINLFLGTHTATERPGIESLARRLQKHLPGLKITGLRETPFE
jgi:dinuclear metal center YbgI/SA1388 family protein